MSKRKENTSQDVSDGNEISNGSPKSKKTFDTRNIDLDQLPNTSESPKSDLCDKIFHCADCPKTFNSKQNMVKHAKLHATWNFVYRCSCCNYSFKSKEGIKKHLKSLKKDFDSIVCTTSYVNSITMEAVGESVVVNLKTRSRRTKKNQSIKEYKKLADKLTAKKTQLPTLYTKRPKNFPTSFVAKATAALSTVITAVEFHDDLKTLLMNSYPIDMKMAVKYGISLQKHQDEGEKNSEEKSSQRQEQLQHLKKKSLEKTNEISTPNLRTTDTNTGSSLLSTLSTSNIDKELEKIAAKYGFNSEEHPNTEAREIPEENTAQQPQHRDDEIHTEEELPENKISPSNSPTIDTNSALLLKSTLSSNDIDEKLENISAKNGFNLQGLQNSEAQKRSKEEAIQQHQENVDIHEGEQKTIDPSLNSSPESLDEPYRLIG